MVSFTCVFSNSPFSLIANSCAPRLPREADGINAEYSHSPNMYIRKNISRYNVSTIRVRMDEVTVPKANISGGTGKVLMALQNNTTAYIIGLRDMISSVPFKSSNLVRCIEIVFISPNY